MKSFELDEEILKLLLEGDDLLDCRLEYEPLLLEYALKLRLDACIILDLVNNRWLWLLDVVITDCVIHRCLFVYVEEALDS